MYLAISRSRWIASTMCLAGYSTVCYTESRRCKKAVTCHRTNDVSSWNLHCTGMRLWAICQSLFQSIFAQSLSHKIFAFTSFNQLFFFFWRTCHLAIDIHSDPLPIQKCLSQYSNQFLWLWWLFHQILGLVEGRRMIWLVPVTRWIYKIKHKLEKNYQTAFVSYCFVSSFWYQRKSPKRPY